MDLRTLSARLNRAGRFLFKLGLSLTLFAILLPVSACAVAVIVAAVKAPTP